MKSVINKPMMIFAFLCYFLSNLLFYKTVNKDYANIVLLFSTVILFVFEVLFWGIIFQSISDNNLSERKQSVEMFFLTGLIGCGLSRIFLTSSPYVNDLLNSNIVIEYLFGVIRLVFIFSSIMNIFYLFDTKNIFLIIISLLNIVTVILIWVDFDSGINGIIKMIMAILALVYIMAIKNKIPKEA